MLNFMSTNPNDRLNNNLKHVPEAYISYCNELYNDHLEDLQIQQLRKKLMSCGMAVLKSPSYTAINDLYTDENCTARHCTLSPEQASFLISACHAAYNRIRFLEYAQEEGFDRKDPSDGMGEQEDSDLI